VEDTNVEKAQSMKLLYNGRRPDMFTDERCCGRFDLDDPGAVYPPLLFLPLGKRHNCKAVGIVLALFCGED